MVLCEPGLEVLQLPLAPHQGLEGRDDLLLYGDPASPARIQALGGHAHSGAADALDGAPVGLGVAGQYVEQCSLARAVAAYQPDLLPCLDRERGAGEDLQVAPVVLDDISCNYDLHGEEIISSWFCPANACFSSLLTQKGDTKR